MNEEFDPNAGKTLDLKAETLTPGDLMICENKQGN